MAGPASARALLVVALLAIVSTASFRTTTSAASDANSLLKFKTSLSGGAQKLPSWVEGSSPCAGNRSDWAGVLCSNNTVMGLQLENMTLSGALRVDALAGLPRLRTLSFMNNSFEGPMPDVRKLRALKTIYLSMNKLSGEIPDDAFTGMGSLKKVHLSGNRFMGPIPTSLAGLPKLLELRLDNNRFTGGIPDLPQPELKLINLSHNNLEGAIPSVLSKLDASSFAGNKNLCGEPLRVPCKPPPGKTSSGPDAAVIVIAVGVILAISGAVFVADRRRRSEDMQLGRPPLSKRAKKLASFQEEKIASSRGERPEQGMDEYGGSGGKAARGHEQGRLVFVKSLKGDWERFELQDLLKASAEVLAGGGLGSSYKASLTNGPSVVVKRFREMNGVGREGFQEHMSRLGRLSHPNLLPLVAYYYRREEKLLVTDYTPGGSLANLLHGNNPKLDWQTRLKIVKGVARGLAYLYDALRMLSLPHGNLKSSNVLLDESYEPLMTDYALVPLMNQGHASKAMVANKAPEIKQFGRTSKKSDVWSFGILILEMLTGRLPDNYQKQGKGGTDLASWVNSILREEQAGPVFDSEMRGTKNGEGEMMKLLKIGLACCEQDVDKRWDMSEALDKIEELRERDGDEDHSSP